jgi:hypothetical protein
MSLRERWQHREHTDNSPTSCVFVLLVAIAVVVEVFAALILTYCCVVPLPLLLYPRGARLQAR